jgi:hypothetical protein
MCMSLLCATRCSGAAAICDLESERVGALQCRLRDVACGYGGMLHGDDDSAARSLSALALQLLWRALPTTAVHRERVAMFVEVRGLRAIGAASLLLTVARRWGRRRSAASGRSCSCPSPR